MTWRIRRLQYLRDTGRYADLADMVKSLEERAARLVTNEQAEKETGSTAGVPKLPVDRTRPKKLHGA